MRGYSLSPQAVDDLLGVWQTIAADSETTANRVQAEFFDLFGKLAGMPGQGHQRKDLTNKPVLFFPLYSYLVIYEPNRTPLQIVTIIHGRRDVKRILRDRGV